jgi:hypothetical protein
MIDTKFTWASFLGWTRNESNDAESEFSLPQNFEPPLALRQRMLSSSFQAACSKMMMMTEKYLP